MFERITVLDVPLSANRIPTGPVGEVELRFRGALITEATHDRIVFNSGEVVERPSRALTACSVVTERARPRVEYASFTLFGVETNAAGVDDHGNATHLQFSDGTGVKTEWLSQVTFRPRHELVRALVRGQAFRVARGIAETAHGYTALWRSADSSREGNLDELTTGIDDDAMEWTYHADRLWYRFDGASQWSVRFVAVSMEDNNTDAWCGFVCHMRRASEDWLLNHFDHLDAITRARPSGRPNGEPIVKWLECSKCLVTLSFKFTD